MYLKHAFRYIVNCIILFINEEQISIQLLRYIHTHTHTHTHTHRIALVSVTSYLYYF